MKKPVYVGIDLGTTTCSVAVCRSDGEPKVVEFDWGGLLDSYVAYDPVQGTARITVGAEAKKRYPAWKDHTAKESKRRIDCDQSQVSLTTACRTALDVATDLLSHLKEKAEEQMGHPVTDVVITVPASFNNHGKQNTKEAGLRAGFRDVTLLQEPVAAALAYAVRDDLKPGERLFVFDLGGGTLDIAVLRNADDDLKVEAFHGDAELGGMNFDHRMFELIQAKFRHQAGFELFSNKVISPEDKKQLSARLEELAEKHKCYLSTSRETTVQGVGFETRDADYYYDLRITRDEFQNHCADLMARIKAVVQKSLADPKVAGDKINRVAMVGGSSRMPMVKKLLEECFPALRPCCDSDPDHLVAQGAARYKWMLQTLQDKPIHITTVAAHSLGLETAEGSTRILIPKGAALPAQASGRFTTSKDYMDHVKLSIYQGEHHRCRNNRLIYGKSMKGLRPARAGAINIDVTFELTREDILKVHARAEGANLRFEADCGRGGL